jgi:hypothetical protein
MAKLTRAINLRDELRAEQERLREASGDVPEYRSTSNERHRDDSTV